MASEVTDQHLSAVCIGKRDKRAKTNFYHGTLHPATFVFKHVEAS